MSIMDEMLHQAILIPDEQQQISSWMAKAGSPEKILQMPPLLVASG